MNACFDVPLLSPSAGTVAVTPVQGIRGTEYLRVYDADQVRWATHLKLCHGATCGDSHIVTRGNMP